MEYSLFSTEIEDPAHGDGDLLSTCRDLGVAVVAYSPLSRGLLGGGVQGPDGFDEGDIRRFYPRYSRENFPKKTWSSSPPSGGWRTRRELRSGRWRWRGCWRRGRMFFPFLGGCSSFSPQLLNWRTGPRFKLTRGIQSTIHPKYLDENFAAMHVELTADESRYIRDLVDKASVFGDRWPKEHALGLFADTPALEGWRGPEEREAVVGTLILDGESGKA